MSVEEWKEVILEDCTSIIFSGGTPNTKNEDFWNGSIRWLSSGETRKTFIYDTEKKITELGIKNSSTKLAKKDDVVIASAGQGHTRGQTSLCKVDTYINQSLISLRSDKNKVDPNYLFYNIYSRYNELRQISDGHSIRGSLTTKIIKDLKIKLPPLDEQKAIANILSSLDEKIEINNKINDTLENMAQELFKRWFVDFEFPDENGEPYRSSGGEMVDSDLGLIPKGWEVKFLELISKIKSGKRPPVKQEKRSKEANYPIAGASKIMGYTNAYNFDSDILVIGRVGTHGIIQRYNDQVWASDNTLVITSEIYEFVYQILRTIDYNSLNRGSTQPLITQKDIKKQKTVVPKMEILQDFEKITSGFFKLVNNNKEKNNHLTKIRDTLLPKLMSGELRVPLEETEEVTAEMKGG